MIYQNESRNITVMNFSNIYEKESFYKGENINWIDCSGIYGTNCYCDEYARKLIKDKISSFNPQGIHFIDSGNYHYVSEFWMEKIYENFNLVVFDHHSDMQTPMFGNILSCGSWIMNSLDSNKYLKKVILIGVGEEEKNFISKEYKKRIICIDRKELKMRNYEDYDVEEYPVYISIDKDVLSEKVIETNWTQGEMKLSELEFMLHKILKQEKVIGIDICGECANDVDKLRDIKNNDMTNLELLEFLKREGISENEFILK
ncbi:arginase family protein [uncultured Clostridium sp.]|uniref:arginase family protein n=1 Tax=uncultured Clostridium sp. TaxID=59620 RepID=UPI0025F18581|nr:arginase family protein [uncultured Clostridium sp.]